MVAIDNITTETKARTTLSWPPVVKYATLGAKPLEGDMKKGHSDPPKGWPHGQGH